MDRGQLIAVNGKICEYDRYDKYLDIHLASEIEIDDEGILTHTYIPCCFSTEELKNNEVEFTKSQWYGIVEHFIRQDYPHLTEEDIETATEDIVGREFAYGRPKTIEDLEKHIATYLNR